MVHWEQMHLPPSTVVPWLKVRKLLEPHRAYEQTQVFLPAGTKGWTYL